jgi:hypothetical protein
LSCAHCATPKHRPSLRPRCIPFWQHFVPTANGSSFSGSHIHCYFPIRLCPGTRRDLCMKRSCRFIRPIWPTILCTRVRHLVELDWACRNRRVAFNLFDLRLIYLSFSSYQLDARSGRQYGCQWCDAMPIRYPIRKCCGQSHVRIAVSIRLLGSKMESSH